MVITLSNTSGGASATTIQTTTSPKISTPSTSVTIRTLVYYTLVIAFISQLIFPVLLPAFIASITYSPSLSPLTEARDFKQLVISFSIGFENNSQLTSIVSISTSKLITLMQWIIHVPLVMLPFGSMLYNKADRRETRMLTYWYCVLLLFFSNVLVSLKQAVFDWIDFIPSFLNSLEMSIRKTTLDNKILETIVKEQSNYASVGLISSQFQASSMLPQLVSFLLIVCICYHFIRDVVLGIPVKIDSKQEDRVQGVKQFISNEFNTCLLPLQHIINYDHVLSGAEAISSKPSTTLEKDENAEQAEDIIYHGKKVNVSPNIVNSSNISSPNGEMTSTTATTTTSPASPVSHISVPTNGPTSNAQPTRKLIGGNFMKRRGLDSKFAERGSKDYTNDIEAKVNQNMNAKNLSPTSETSSHLAPTSKPKRVSFTDEDFPPLSSLDTGASSDE
ncbi:hypothetical protein C9374_003594 [Naegleria lovaniensis]|uniref:Uncharacterized protein n=1 Tax=Naegleria lovaniensis TaxID=51637 RepID=A0AA88GZJ4_NAELO|nr:uncharacterized protein C9374_003594 [Naegleria lovaniensis]KAG2393830.1 hypothetical protein C9374_003594 [Naegleria lovaniensis]